MNTRIAPRFFPAVLIAALMAFTGCSSKFQHALNFNPHEPIRVAVLPFAEVDKDGKIVERDYKLFIDKIPGLSSELNAAPAAYMQALVHRELSRTAFDLVSPALVDAQLSHNGFARGKQGFDMEKVMSASAKDICLLLACDAVVYGKVTAWDRDYLAVQTVNQVGLDLRMVSAADGRELFSASAKDYESRGLTKGPTGISSVVIEPIRGLDNDIITQLAQHTVQKMLQPLFADNSVQDTNKTPPPSIYSAAHDADGQPISEKRPLIVLMFATPAKQASFSIGKVIQDVPMIERDKGHYYGEFYPLSVDSLSNEIVTVKLVDEFGRANVQRLGSGPVSTESHVR